MPPIVPPTVSWQFTGNHWLALPCIHPVDGAVHAVGVLHRGARAAVEFAGARDFTAGTGPGLLTPRVKVNGIERQLAGGGIAWERALGWLPTFTARLDDLLVRGTVFAPFGRDADMAGAVYAITIENRASQPARVEVALDGLLAHRQQRVRSARAYDDAHRVVAADDGIVVMEGAALPGVVSLAVGADGDAALALRDGASPGFTLAVERTVAAGATGEFAFYLAAGPERDGAVATVGVLRRRGWRPLLSATRDAIRSLEQETGNERVDRLVMSHLLFAYFYAVGRALDDAHYYLVRSRAPWNGRGLTVRDWEALMWTLPAVQLADPQLGRELLLRMCEVHGYAPGQGVHYLDGTLFEPGFLLEGIAAYPIAIDRYIRDSGDEQVVEEPLVADALYGADDDLRARRDAQTPLYATDVTVGGTTARAPFTLHGNAAVALALDILRRTLDEEAAKDVPDPEATRAAIRRHLVTDQGGKALFAAASDLSGQVVAGDDPHASALWLPLLEAATREESIFRRTAKSLPASQPELAYRIARLLGPDSTAALAWLQAAALDQGKAAEFVDVEGRAIGNGGDAALSGLLAYVVWYVMHTTGARG
ncbi:MAG: hypothetical protein HY275_06545 [Gemmatimonadetes bacterium]|nr:hypothetical protein [Gemmatimonadota bacterium]